MFLINHNLFHSGTAKKFLRFGTFNKKSVPNFFKFNFFVSWKDHTVIETLMRRIGVLINPILDVAIVAGNTKTNSKNFPTSDNSFLKLGQ